MDFLQEFAKDLKIQGLATSTEQGYLRNVEEFLNFALQYGQDSGVFTAKIVDEHLSALSKAGQKAKTLNWKRMSIRAFLKFLDSRGLLAPNVLDLIDPIPEETVAQTVLSPEEVRKMLAAIHGPCALRDRAILLLFYGSGLRVSELVDLSVEDIRLPNREVRVAGKGGRDRVAPMTQECAKAIEEYTGRWRTLHGDPTTPNLFVRLDGKPLARRTVSWEITLLARRAEVRHSSSHTLRRTCATTLLNNGMPIEEVSHVLGHLTIAETEPYLGTTPEQVLQTYRQHFKPLTEGPK